MDLSDKEEEEDSPTQASVVAFRVFTLPCVNSDVASQQVHSSIPAMVQSSTVASPASPQPPKVRHGVNWPCVPQPAPRPGSARSGATEPWTPVPSSQRPPAQRLSVQ